MPQTLEYAWATASLQEGRLNFDRPDGLENALRDGFFFVAAPPSLDLSIGDRFATSFYLENEPGYKDDYRSFRNWTDRQLGTRQGYATRPADQVEQFFLEGPGWRKVFPSELAEFVEGLRDFGIGVLKAVLTEVDLPRSLWDTATGYATAGCGTYTMAFNHYRPTVRSRGLNIHKDSGWVTILRASKPGLEVRRNDEWHPIAPRPNAFIVNFGCTMEILTRDTNAPVAAVEHRVTEQRSDGQTEDRFSYGMFVDNSLDPTVSNAYFRYVPGQGLVELGEFQTFLDELMNNAYGAESLGLY